MVGIFGDLNFKLYFRHVFRTQNGYQPSIDATVVKQYGQQVKTNVFNPITFTKYKE